MKKDFLKYRYIFLIISFLVIVGGISYGLITGYKFDIDFKGGTVIQTDLKEEFDNNEIEKIVYEVTGNKPLVQKVTGGEASVTITCEPMEQELADKVVDSLKERYTNMDEPSTRNVQASYSKELLYSAMLAVGVAIVVILLYVGVRFKTLGFSAAITAIIALAHDVLVVVAVYGVIKFPINSTFVAVILTIIGYSINDTIVVYDRIRENKRKVSRSADLKDTINLSISQVMKRTILTSLTTVTAVLVVYIFALINNQQVLKEFSLPLIIGVIVGTYSSIFVASSLWYTFDTIGTKIKLKKGEDVSKKRKSNKQ